MSVDYYSCECCGEARYEEAVTYCEGCGNHICCDCICNIDEFPKAKYYFPEGSENDNGELKKIYCPICCQKAIEDANPHKDFLGKALNIGDSVVAVGGRTKITYLYKGIIKTLSPIRAGVLGPSGRTTSIEKKLIIKI